MPRTGKFWVINCIISIFKPLLQELLRDNSVPVVSAVDVCGEKISTCNFGFTAGELIPSDRLSEKKNKPESLKV